jgi:hypothetical protein
MERRFHRRGENAWGRLGRLLPKPLQRQTHQSLDYAARTRQCGRLRSCVAGHGCVGHAFILDYKAIERVSYIEAFFPNINWKTVEHRLERTMVPTSIPALT